MHTEPVGRRPDRRRPKPALPAILTEQRALEVMDKVPLGHGLMRIDDDRHEPHLWRFESAVYDTNDREPAWDELFVIQQSAGPIIWLVSRAKAPWQTTTAKGEPVAMLHPLNKTKWRDMPDGRKEPVGEMRMSDGPLPLSYLRELIIGRVVGVVPDRRGRK